MNRKLIFMIILLLLPISIMIIAVFGTLPEQGNLDRINTLSFVDEEIIETSDNNYILDIRERVTLENATLTIQITYKPFPAGVDLRVKTSNENVVAMLDSDYEHVIIIFDIGLIAKREAVYVTVWDTYTGVTSVVDLMFKNPDDVIVE